MSGFLYFVPNTQTIDAGQIDGLGIEAIKGLVIGSQMHTSGGAKGAGPDGLGGVLFAPVYPGEHARQASIEPRPEKYKWRKGRKGKWWVGVDKSNLPTPEDLERERVGLAAHRARERKAPGGWQMPICLDWGGASTLPWSRDLDDDGEWVRKVDPEWLRLSELATGCYDAINNPDGGVIPERDFLELIALGLSVNYYVSRWEIALLGILNDQSEHEFLRAIWGLAWLEEIQEDLKKKDNLETESGVTTADGDAG